MQKSAIFLQQMKQQSQFHLTRTWQWVRCKL